MYDYKKEKSVNQYVYCFEVQISNCSLSIYGNFIGFFLQLKKENKFDFWVGGGGIADFPLFGGSG